MVFDKDWFKTHQRKLLWLLNTTFIKVWFRWVLRIRRCDLPIQTRIIEIGPNFFTHSPKIKGEIVEITTSFRSNEKYAMRLWFAFEPIWWILHAWDWLTKPFPILNLGFDTLPTKYSTPGSTVSGRVVRESINETLSVIRAGAGNGSAYDIGDYGIANQLRCSGTTNQYDRLYRGIFLFDTSAIGPGKQVISATIGLCCVYLRNQHSTAPNCEIVSANPASNTVLANGDYSNLGSTSFASIPYADFTVDAYESFSLNADGKSSVAMEGISKFGSVLSWDLKNSGPEWGSGKTSDIYFYDGGKTGTTKDPKIDITYGIPASGYINLMMLGIG